VANDARLRDVVKVIKGRVESDAVRRAVLEDLKGIHGGAEGSSIVDSRNVDVLVSEPMGTMLFNERMIESFLIARDVFLKPKGGQMFPRAARLHCAPFEDFTLRAEILDKATFWCSNESKDFYGIDVSVLGPEATKTYFAQPVVDAFDPTMLLADPATFEFDFLGDETKTNGETKRRLNAEHLERLFLRADFVARRDGVAHGLAWWFDVEFDVRNPIGSSTRNGQNRRFLTTAPGAPTTHWFQIRLPFRDPMKIARNARVETETEMIASANQSYAVTAVLARGDSDGNNKNVSTKEQAVSGTWNLKDPYYRQLHYPQPGYTEAQTKRWYGDEAAEVRGADARFFADAERRS
jgi:histone-arginine methyltransferase CARM1